MMILLMMMTMMMMMMMVMMMMMSRADIEVLIETVQYHDYLSLRKNVSSCLKKKGKEKT